VKSRRVWRSWSELSLRPRATCHFTEMDPAGKPKG
jgi:hypothetical protein